MRIYFRERFAPSGRHFHIEKDFNWLHRRRFTLLRVFSLRDLFIKYYSCVKTCAYDGNILDFSFKPSNYLHNIDNKRLNTSVSNAPMTHPLHAPTHHVRIITNHAFNLHIDSYFLISTSTTTLLSLVQSLLSILSRESYLRQIP